MKTLQRAADKRNVDYFCPNVRMGTAIAAALEAAGFLRSAQADFCVPPAATADALRRVVGLGSGTVW